MRIMHAQSKSLRSRVNLTVRKDYLDEARKAGVNLSRVLEESLAARLKAERERRWLAQNAEAIEAQRAQVEAQGLWHRGLTDWY
jgi:antitoxin CcdA